MDKRWVICAAWMLSTAVMVWGKDAHAVKIRNFDDVERAVQVVHIGNKEETLIIPPRQSVDLWVGYVQIKDPVNQRVIHARNLEEYVVKDGKIRINRYREMGR